MRRNAVLSGALATMALALGAGTASAQGFGVYEHDACAMGRAGTGVAAPCNAPTAAFINPAGMVDPGGRRWSVSLGVTGIKPAFTFQDSIRGTSTDAVSNMIPVPNFYVVRQLGGSVPMAVGLGVFAPYGLRSEWPTTFEGRFLAYVSDLKAIYIQPTIAAQLKPWLQVGVGFDYIHSIVDLAQRIDLSSQVASGPLTFGMLGIPSGTDFADASVEGSGNSIGFHLGAMIRASNRLRIGVRYLGESTAGIEGDATFTQISTGIVLPPGNPLGAPGGTPLDAVLAGQFQTGGALATQTATVDIPLPAQLIVGVQVQASQKLSLLLDVQTTFWSAFEQLNLEFAQLGAQPQYEDYNNTVGVRVGAEYALSPRVSIRGGTLYHQAAAPAQTVTPLLPEAERAEGTVGLSFNVGRRGRVDLAYQHIWQADRRGRIVEAVRGPAGVASNTGLYSATGDLFAASLAWGF